jgi:hypothetical protein
MNVREESVVSAYSIRKGVSSMYISPALHFAHWGDSYVLQ